MENGVRICSDSKRAFPRVPNLIHQAISAAFAHNQRDLFIDILLELLGVQMLNVLKQPP